MLPKDFPKWKSVYHYFREWKRTGVWKRIHDRWRALGRRAAGRHPQPSAAILDSQSVKTTEVGGPDRGYDAGKKVNGRKRHWLVDTMGLVLAVVVHAASVQDRDGARQVLAVLKQPFTRRRLIWADSLYTGGLADWLWPLRTRRKVRLEIVKRQDPQAGFVVQPHRWIIERTFGWLGRHRRLSKDYETLPCRACVHSSSSFSGQWSVVSGQWSVKELRNAKCEMRNEKSAIRNPQSAIRNSDCPLSTDLAGFGLGVGASLFSGLASAFGTTPRCLGQTN